MATTTTSSSTTTSTSRLSTTTTTTTTTSASHTVTDEMFCEPMILSQNTMLMPPCNNVDKVPHGVVCILSCQPTFQLKSGNAKRKCNNTIYTGLPLICECSIAMELDKTTKQCVRKELTTQTTTEFKSTTSTLTSSLTTTNVGGSSESAQDSNSSQSGLIVAVVVSVLLLLVFLLVGIIRFRKSSEEKGTIMEELSTPNMVTNPTYSAAGPPEINRADNPLYAGTINTDIPRQNNALYETEDASIASEKLYSGYVIPSLDTGDGAQYEVVSTNTPGKLYAPLDTLQYEVVTTKAQSQESVTKWAIPLHEQEC
eukprot:m.56438 g.56438  ORF g.56438 m.56438 type:complete len:312 (-) comp11039_c0_seq1:187-1122(-)